MPYVKVHISKTQARKAAGVPLNRRLVKHKRRTPKRRK